jgi:hypothetical protein
VTVTLKGTGFEPPPPAPPLLPPPPLLPAPPPQLDMRLKLPTTNETSNAVHSFLRLLQPKKHTASASEVPARNGWPSLRTAADEVKLKTVNGVVTGDPETVTIDARA